MPYLQSNIPHFKCWVRREYTHNHEAYHGEFLHAMAVAVTTLPNRCLSFQMIFTGIEAEGEENEQGEDEEGGYMRRIRQQSTNIDDNKNSMGKDDNTIEKEAEQRRGG